MRTSQDIRLALITGAVTAEELAARSGVSAGVISYIRNGRDGRQYDPRESTVAQLVEALEAILSESPERAAKLNAALAGQEVPRG